MKYLVVTAFLLALTACDIMQYSRGEVKEKEIAINEVGDGLYSCFEKKGIPKFSFKIKRIPKESVLSSKDFGLLIPSSIQSENDKSHSCIKHILSGIKIRMVMIVDEELITIKRNETRSSWMVVPNPKYFNHGD